jgi:hypothetical protein
MKIICILLLAGLAMVGTQTPLHAQEWFGSATWDISIPDGDTKEFVDETSFRGFGLDFRHQFRENMTFGIQSAWEVFHQRTSGSFTVGNATITGSNDRYLNSFPIMLNLHAYFGNEGGTRPYIGINGGGFILIQTLRVGLAEFEEDTWEWGLAPEAGLIIPLQSGAGLIINGRYNWALTGEDLNGEDRTLTYWGVRVGFIWEQY